MQQTQSPKLRELLPHGTKTFPCAVYQRRAVGKGTLVKHHWHEEVEILYFFGGTFRLEINMEPYPVLSECIYFINPGELHTIITERSGSSGEDAVVFHPNVLNFNSCDTAQTQLLQPIQAGELQFPRCLTPDHPAFAPIRDALTDIMLSFGRRLREDSPTEDGAVTDDLTEQLYIKSSLLRILAVLSETKQFQAAQKNMDKRVTTIKAALTYIKKNYRDKIYIRDLAQLVNMNEQYFCRFFKRAIGYSPMEYVNEYRIKQSLRLLEDTALPVMEVCLKSGYNNLGNFLREFKKRTDTTPLQYRKQFLSAK